MPQNSTPDINRETLKKLRNRLGLSLKEMALKVDVDKDTIYRWERLIDGKPERTIRERHHKNIADALGVSVSRLYGPPPSDINKEEELVQHKTLTDKADMMLSQICDTFHLNRNKALEFSITLLHITAAASLGHRRQQVMAMKNDILSTLERTANNLPYLAHISEVDHIEFLESFKLWEETAAVNNHQLFNEDWSVTENDPLQVNPYANFLQPIVDLIPQELKDRYITNWSTDDLPNVEISDQYLAESLNLQEDHILFPTLKAQFKSGALKYDDLIVLAKNFSLIKVLCKNEDIEKREIIKNETHFSDDTRMQDILARYRDSFFSNDLRDSDTSNGQGE